LFHLSAIRLIVAIVPVRLAATAQAIYGTFCVGLVIGLVTVESGFLYARFGGLAFLFMAGLCRCQRGFVGRTRNGKSIRSPTCALRQSLPALAWHGFDVQRLPAVGAPGELYT
jgi:hypothetical protein